MNRCPYCDVELPPRRKQCGAPECARLYRNARQRQFQQDHRDQHGQSHTRRYDNGSSYRAHMWARIARRRGATVVEVFDPLEVFEEQHWICGLCHEPVDPSVAYPDVKSKSLDHITPLSKGGEHTKANAQLAHMECNSYKGGADGELWVSPTGDELIPHPEGGFYVPGEEPSVAA